MTHPRQRSAEDVLKDVLELTGATMAGLRHHEMGPRANPARRFAVWALNRSSVLSQREVGKMLNVSYAQVTRLLTRLRQARPAEPLAGWMSDWLADEAGKAQVSSAGV